MPQNELRIFISSTFRDLQEEREHLVRKIFPEIRALCRERGITFTEVDLRWGLTDEHVALGQVVRACLEEIDRCRPFFLGLVGERYGWAPEMIEYYKDPDLFERWPWLEEAAIEGASITDIEFRHGALNDPDAAGRARFFVRDLDATGPEKETDRQLDDLKDRLRRSGLDVVHFGGPHELGKAVLSYLKEAIERDFADARRPTPLEGERKKHAAFAASRRRAYIPNPTYLKILDDWFSRRDTSPLVLYAESGSGKSSLVSFWCELLRRRSPDLFVVEHYVGIGAGDFDHIGVMRHVIEEIKERYNRSEEVPTRPGEIERDFANWLGFGVGSPMLLILDGINQLGDHARELHWLPPVMPDGVKLLVSSTVEQTLVDVRKRGWQELGMQPLSEKEREAVVVRVLAEYRKALSPERIQRIASDPKSAHPLFLRTLLEELRLHGNHEHLDEHLDRLLATTGTEDLFQRVLERFEEDFTIDDVCSVLSLIRASRSGLDEEELSILTGIGRLKLSTMLLGLDYHLIRRNGVLTFFHDFLLRAVEKRYAGDAGTERTWSAVLARFFETRPIELRSSLELLAALEKLGENDRLERNLAEMDRFMVLWNEGERETVLRLWSEVEIDSVAEVYRMALNMPDEQSRDREDRRARLGAVAELMELIGNWTEAEELHYKRLELLADDRSAISRTYCMLSGLAGNLGRIDESLELVRTAEEVARSADDMQAISAALLQRGGLHRSRDESDDALACYAEAEQTARRIDNERQIAMAIGNRGLVHADRGEYPEALDCYDEFDRLARQIGDRRLAVVHVNNRGIIHKRRGEYDEALACFHRYESVGRELGDRHALIAAACNIGLVHLHRNEFPEALACFSEQERIARELGSLYSIGAAIGNRGNVHGMLGNHDEALECFAELEQVARTLSRRSMIATAIGNRGIVYAARRDYNEALACFRRAVDEDREVANLYGITLWLEGIASALLELCELPTMPEYLPSTVPDADPAAWREPTLAVIRETLDECTRINEELLTSDGLLSARVLRARLEAAEGNADRAVARLKSMLDEEIPNDQRADALYLLWKIGDRQAQPAALELYEMLFEQAPVFDYRQRIEELSGTID